MSDLTAAEMSLCPRCGQAAIGIEVDWKTGWSVEHRGAPGCRVSQDEGLSLQHEFRAALDEPPMSSRSILIERAAQRVEREIRHLLAVPGEVTTVAREAMVDDLRLVVADIRALGDEG